MLFLCGIPKGVQRIVITAGTAKRTATGWPLWWPGLKYGRRVVMVSTALSIVLPMERSTTGHVTCPSGSTTKLTWPSPLVGSLGVGNELLECGLYGVGGTGREEQQQHEYQPLAVRAVAAGVSGQNGAGGVSRKFIAGRNRAKRASAR